MEDKQLWFKAKKYGWGWYPISWQGWIVLLVYIGLVAAILSLFDTNSHSGSDTLIGFSLPFIGLTTLLLSVCYMKGETPRWSWGDSWPEARNILKEIRKAETILLHCHPSPDPDSVGSVLAMKFALESLGKKVTAIKGDSDIPQAFKHFPGAETIVAKNLYEVDLKDFDLFIILDAGSPEMVSKIKIPEFPLSIRTVVIDHHASNKGYGDVNIVDLTSPATGYLLYKLFKEWEITITPQIATNLFMGMYTDTGAFRYPPTDYKVFHAAAELTRISPDYSKTIAQMNNSKTKESLMYESLALASLKIYFDDRLAITAVAHRDIATHNIRSEDVSATFIPNQLISVARVCVGISLAEREPNVITLSSRSKDAVNFDVSKLALALGGGGHKNAAGATLKMSLDDAVKKVVETAKVMYNL